MITYYKNRAGLTVLCQSSTDTDYSCVITYTETSRRRRRAVSAVPQALLTSVHESLNATLQDNVNEVSLNIASYSNRLPDVTSAELQQIQGEINNNNIDTTDLIDNTKNVIVLNLQAPPTSLAPPTSAPPATSAPPTTPLRSTIEDKVVNTVNET